MSLSKSLSRSLSRSLSTGLTGDGLDPDFLAYRTLASSLVSEPFDLTGTAGYDSDFSAGTDGWIAVNGPIAGNIDGIGGRNDCLRFTVNNVSTFHAVRRSVSNGETYTITGDYYIPSTNTHVDGVAFAWWSNGSSLGVHASPSLDTWNSFSIPASTEDGNEDSFAIQVLDGGSGIVNDPGGNDVIYIRNVVIRNTAYASFTTSETEAGRNALVTYLKGQGNGLFSAAGTYGTMPTASNVWNKLIELVPESAAQFAAFRAKLKYATTSTTTNSAFVAGDYDPTSGLTDAASKFLNLNYDLTSDLNITDGATIGMYLISNDSTASGRLMGRYVAASNEATFLSGGSSAVTANPGALASSGTGIFSHSFKNGSQILYKNGTSAASATGTGLTMPSGSLHGLGVNGLTGDTGCTQAWQWVAEFLTPAEQEYLAWCLNADATYFGYNTFDSTVRWP